MTSWPETPDFGALLRAHIERVPAVARPAFLAGLERSAAARYRSWAEEAPEHAPVLLECARREDQIADLVAELFPISAADRSSVDEHLPDAIDVYYDVFAPYTLIEQLHLQAGAELQGAQAWVGMADQVDDPAARAVLACCAALEEESSRAVQALIAGDDGSDHGPATPAAPSGPPPSAPNDFPREAVRAMPKAELHVHLEGTVDASTLLMLAEHHHVQPPADTVEGVGEWYRFDGFPMFLERYFTVLGLLRDPEDFALVAERYLTTAHAQGVVHVEFHVSATGHILENGLRWAPVHDGIVDGCERAAAATGVSWGLIPDVSPHLPAAECIRAMDGVFAHDLDHVVAIGMGGPADTWTIDDFSPVYARARALGIPAVAHAAEHGGAAEVRFAIERFGATRIQHGIGVMEDPAVVDLLVERGIPCDVCPGSNLALHAVESAAAHPLPAMLDAGITVTLGSDDPPMFQTTLLDEYERAWAWAGLDLDGLARLARNSIDAASTPARVRAT